MPNPDYEYHGLLAATWDAFRGDTSVWPDRAFYREAIRRFGEPALDVGCGTGRLLLDYRAEGIDVDGVDVSREMLALCRDKAERLGVSVRIFEQPMEELDLPRRYRCIIVPSSSIQLLLDPAGAAAAMRRFHDHLEPGGALVMPFMTLWAPGEPLESESTDEAIRADDGATLRRTSRTRFDPATGLEDTDDRYDVIVDGEVVESEHHLRSPATRSYTQEDAVRLYAEGGFDRVELFGEFTWDPVTPDARIFCATGSAQRDERT